MYMKIDVVVPFFNEEHVIEDFLLELDTLNKSSEHDLNLLFVDDGSTDSTSQRIQNFENDIQISITKFSRNFGKEKAIFAGLSESTSEYVIVMDSDLQHPVRLIPDLIKALIINDVEMVYTINTSRNTEPYLIRLAKHSYHYLMTKIQITNHVQNAGDFRIMSRKVVEEIVSYKGNNFYMKSMYHWAGYPAIGLDYKPDERKSGKSKFNLTALVKLAIMGITGNSYTPLYLSFYVGLTVFFATLIFSGYIVTSKLLGIITVPGFATIVVLISLLFAINFLLLGCIGLYLGRIMENIDGRSRYIIDKKITIKTNNDKR